MSRKKSKKDYEIDDYLYRLGVFSNPRPIGATREDAIREGWIPVPGGAGARFRRRRTGAGAQEVSPVLRRLRANWTIELADDLRAMHNIDIETIANEMAREIDNQMLDRLIPERMTAQGEDHDISF